MTPAAIQSRVYVGIVPGEDQRDCERLARELFATRRPLLEGTGWELSYHAGSDPPPMGAVLIGAVACRVAGECDINLYVYPRDPGAMLLRDRCCHHHHRRDPQPGGRYLLQVCYQDSNWEDLQQERYNDLRAAEDRSESLSRHTTRYGMVRIIDTEHSRIVRTYPAGD